jgi:hypothetical protein
MCPLKQHCPYDIRPRWPHSDIKANTPFGIACPYAHHITELKFEQEIKNKLKFKLNHLKSLEKDIDPVIIDEWIPTGPIISCSGCGKTYSDKVKGKGGRSGAAGGPKGLCGFCRLNQKKAIDLAKEKRSADKTNKEILQNYVSKPEEYDAEYITKFGMLKKSAVLYSFRRYTDAFEVINKAKIMIESDQLKEDERFKNLDIKWRTKLQINEDIPKEILNYEITKEVVDYFKIKTPIQNLILYIEKMRKGTNFTIYNRHTYLNNQIFQFHKIITKTLDKFKSDIKYIKYKISNLDFWSEKKNKLRNDPKVYRKFKNKMCKNIMMTGKCDKNYRDCKDAHNPIQLNLTELSTEKKLLENNLRLTLLKTQKSKTVTPWQYPKQKIYEKGVKFDKEKLKRIIRSKSEKRNRSIDINRLRINFHEI